jgi:hypothetical protein
MKILKILIFNYPLVKYFRQILLSSSLCKLFLSLHPSFLLLICSHSLPPSLWVRLATWWRPRFLRFEATSCLVTHERELLFNGSHVLQRLKREKMRSSSCLLSARWNDATVVNSGAWLHCSLNIFFFKQWRHAFTVQWTGFFFFLTSTLN